MSYDSEKQCDEIKETRKVVNVFIKSEPVDSTNTDLIACKSLSFTIKTDKTVQKIEHRDVLEEEIFDPLEMCSTHMGK